MNDSQTLSVHSVNFGALEIPKDKVVFFKEGLPGFPQTHRFALLEHQELTPFQYLQSLDEPPVALLVINPVLVDPGYRVQADAADMEEIHGTGLSQISVYAVVTIPENARAATLNLMAPILINENERLGKQVILHQSGYPVRRPLFGTQGKSESGQC